jgi:hypothetical protein
MDFERDERGNVTSPDFHDGELLGMVLSPAERSLRLCCRTVDKQEYELHIPKIVRLLANNFREGDIIFEVAPYEGARVSEHAVKALWQYDEAMAKKLLATQMREIRSSGWTLLEIGSSYGCELLAMSRQSPADTGRHRQTPADIRVTAAARAKGSA